MIIETDPTLGRIGTHPLTGKTDCPNEVQSTKRKAQNTKHKTQSPTFAKGISMVVREEDQMTNKTVFKSLVGKTDAAYRRAA